MDINLLETVVQKRINEDIVDEIKEKKLEELADMDISNPPLNTADLKEPDRVDALPIQKRVEVLQTDTTPIKETEMNISKKNNASQKIQSRGTREPAPINPIVFHILNEKERAQPPATLAGQFSSEQVIDNNDTRGDLSKSYGYKKIPKDLLSKKKQTQTELEAKLIKPVFYSKYDQLKEQVAININDPNYARLSDLSFDKQEDLIKSKFESFREPRETNWKRIKRKDFVLTRPRIKNQSGLITRGLMSKNIQKFTTSDSVSLVRRSNAVANFVENIFNPTFKHSD